jgi:hypothetical protein
LTPIISRVLIAEAPPAVGVGIGEPCMTGAGDEITFIAAVSGGCEAGEGRGRGIAA